MFKFFKSLLAIAASAYGCMQLLGLGLTGTGATPITELALLVLGLPCAAGIIIAFLPKVALTHVLTAASTPVCYLVFLMVLGAIEGRELPSILSVIVLFGIVVMITFPEAIKMYIYKKGKPDSK